VFADQLLHQHIFWHARWDRFKIKINMSNTDFDLENVIPVTEANLRDEQKQAIAKAMEEYKQQCLKSFSINRSGEVIQKEAFPAPRHITFEANPSKLQDMVHSAINRALINQAGVLSNMVFNAVARTFKEGQLPPNYVGPAYHHPGSSLVTAPSATTAVAGVDIWERNKELIRKRTDIGEHFNWDVIQSIVFIFLPLGERVHLTNRSITTNPLGNKECFSM